MWNDTVVTTALLAARLLLSLLLLEGIALLQAQRCGQAFPAEPDNLNVGRATRHIPTQQSSKKRSRFVNDDPSDDPGEVNHEFNRRHHRSDDIIVFSGHKQGTTRDRHDVAREAKVSVSVAP